MALMTWTADKFGTTVAIADEQHQEIFNMVNGIYDAAGAGDRAAVGKQLDALIDYVVMHFQTEERLMQEKNYPDYVSHKALHDKLVETCAGLQTQFHAGQAEVTQGTMEFVRDWLFDHIPNVDMKYGPALNS
jgi:hemerythrin